MISISNSYIVGFSIFIAALSAIGPGLSNLPFYLIFLLIYLFLRPFSHRQLAGLLLDNCISISSVSLFLVFATSVSFISILFFPGPFSLDTFIFSITWLISLFFYCRFSFYDLLTGIVIGYFPISFFSFFVEIPSKLFIPEIFNSFRTLLGLRPSVSLSPIGFFEEPSHAPALLILVLVCSLYCLFDSNTLNLYLKRISMLNIIVSLLHVSGMYIYSLYLPSLITLILLLFFVVFIKNRFRLSLLRLISLFFIFTSLLLVLVGKWFIAKLTLSLSISDHSSSSRFISFFSGIFDLFTRCTFGCIGQFRDTRFISSLDFLSFTRSSFPDAYSLVLNMINFSGLDSSSIGTPVYSLWGYVHSEFGLAALLLSVPWIYLSIQGLFTFIQSLSIRAQIKKVPFFTSLICLLPLFYFFNMTFGYPRAFPFALISVLVYIKYIQLHRSQLHCS